MLTKAVQKAVLNAVEQFELTWEVSFDANAVLAFVDVESAGKPYWKVNGKLLPPIRPECHYFLRNLPEGKKQRGIELGLAHKSWRGVTVPSSYAGVYERFDKMRSLDTEAAYKSISIGLGQVMGENSERLGYDSPMAMYNIACDSIEGQVGIMLAFISADPRLMKALKRKDWATVARIYNGPAYKRNKYDEKLASRYAAYVSGTGGKLTQDTLFVRTYQEHLVYLGYDLVVDGVRGPKTRSALRQFQAYNDLVVDGDYGPMTAKALEARVTEKRKKKIDKNTGVGVGVGTVGVGVVIDKLPVSVWDRVVDYATSTPVVFVTVLAVGAGVWAYMNWRK